MVNYSKTSLFGFNYCFCLQNCLKFRIYTSSTGILPSPSSLCCFLQKEVLHILSWCGVAFILIPVAQFIRQRANISFFLISPDVCLRQLKWPCSYNLTILRFTGGGSLIDDESHSKLHQKTFLLAFVLN